MLNNTQQNLRVSMWCPEWFFCTVGLMLAKEVLKLKLRIGFMLLKKYVNWNRDNLNQKQSEPSCLFNAWSFRFVVLWNEQDMQNQFTFLSSTCLFMVYTTCMCKTMQGAALTPTNFVRECLTSPLGVPNLLCRILFSSK